MHNKTPRVLISPALAIPGRPRMKFGLVLLIACVALYVAASAAASSAEMVTGAGFSTNSGFVVVHAKATAPPTGPEPASAPAVGFLRVSGSPSFGDGDTQGTVTCMASLDNSSDNVVVSGVLDEPFVSGDFTFPNFSFLVRARDPLGNQYGVFFIDDLSFFASFGDPCGVSLNFAAGTPWSGFADPEAFRFQRGNFALH